MKKRGRPSIDTGRSTSVHLRLSAKSYDHYLSQAMRQRRSVPDLIRRLLDANKAVPKIDSPA